MRENKLLIVFFVSAGVLSFLLYRAVVKAPSHRETHPKKANVVQKSPHQEKDAKKKAKVEIRKRTGSKIKVQQSGKEGPFEKTKELSPEEKKRLFEEEMRANVPPDMSKEEHFKSSMKADRLEKMSEEEKKELFLRSMGEQLSEEERRARFEGSMGIIERE
ncbi:MAG: hypothetical protein JRI46_03825 [Deltaproteobacteria bacterium]|nr:hypothetical protein [Deltaproteobacteria bacterium]